MTPEKTINRAHRDPSEPAYDNPVGNKGGNVLPDEKKGGPREQRPKHRPVGHASDEKLGRKPPV